MVVMTTLTLGPLLFNWAPERVRDFYLRIADEAPVDTVHLGEVVCSNRAPFLEPHIEEIAARLVDAGKSVVFSSLALVTTDREAAVARALAADPDLLVEVNDIGLLAAVAGRPHVIGPMVNVYNEATLEFLAGRGAMRICVPAELPLRSIAALASASSVELEVIAFGRLPLAISARCFHARAHLLHKDGCQFVCAKDPNGMAVETLDGEPFLAVNGTQTLTYSCCNLVGDLAELVTAGVRRFRLLPLAVDMITVARTFRDVLDKRLDPSEAVDRLGCVVRDVPFANGFIRGTEGRRFTLAGEPE